MKKLGTVTLLGAGCGKGLITVEGMKALKAAEVVVYDDLIDTDLLLELSPECEKIYVGKRFAKHSEKQEKIQEVLIEKAKEGKRVVRLKGGDSFVFGRGGEEMEALIGADIPARVIPGISSGIAVPEHLGIPVTHRGVAQTVTFITGHVASENHIDYQVLAKLGGTLVFFMGLHHAEEIAKRLMEGGKSPSTPAAILSDGYGAGEEKKVGTLETLGELAKTAKTPALILVGEVAAYDFSSTMRGPLTGTSVTVTGTAYFAQKLGSLLEEQGAYVVRKPGIRIVPAEENYPENYKEYDWVAFTSANGVRGFFDHLKKTGTDLRNIMHLRFACIGSGSAEMLKCFGFTADYVPEDYTAKALGQGLGRILGTPSKKTLSAEDSVADQFAIEEGKKLLILRADNGSKLLNVELEQAGVLYEDRKIYTTEAISDQIESQRNQKTDYMVFASANGARIHLKKMADAGENLKDYFQEKYMQEERLQKEPLQEEPLQEAAKIVCIGEATAQALGEFGINLEKAGVIFPESHTAEAIVEAIVKDALSDEKS